MGLCVDGRFNIQQELMRRKMVESAKECVEQKPSNSEIYGKMQAVFIEMDSCPSANSDVHELEDLKMAVMNGKSELENAKDTFVIGL
ncbi:probable boron transporter 7 isoform X2 [Cannabis sativa]|uniref:probable boron transporter 7 isoform X2 n=1 Tax=Cannabis sativa TaxID=3483 RepID=UPI0029CA4A66|nr:probable boron transporter 7 isoform X2 [Cannabis sativa]